jgi:hypothetical protein
MVQVKVFAPTSTGTDMLKMNIADIAMIIVDLVFIVNSL